MLDDPVPGSNWNGGHYYGEPIPRVKPKAKTNIGRWLPGRENTPPQIRQQAIKRLQDNTDPEVKQMKNQARRKAIAYWMGQQDA